MAADIRNLISQLTLEEKAGLCSGADFWHTKAIERLGIPSIMMTDGPHGLRKASGGTDAVGLSNSVPSTCFPTASATASSWDRDLLQEIGRAMAEECLQEEVSVILGPGTNIKRSPLCGRNFEYFSEDPYLAGEMSASLIEGIQVNGVGTSLKHYAANNQEYRRMTIDSVVDERTLREIYLPAFEKAVKKGQPWTVMCSYNRLNGEYACESYRLLTGILREEWGYDGVVVTDWGACNDRVKGLAAGQDLEMPSSNGMNDAKIIQAIKSGALDEAVLDKVVERLLRLIFIAVDNRKAGFRYDPEAHHALARRAAAESAVLLKNDDAILPLKKELKIAVIGAFAKSPRYQGAGSSQINPSRLDTAWDELSHQVSALTYSAGYDLAADNVDDALVQEACAAAKNADVALVFAGLPAVYESEGFDRTHLSMPENHNVLIDRVAKSNPNTVVILANGSPMEMPWLGQVKAVLEGYLGGQAGGSAAVDVLLGKVNPSGKLAETFAHKLEDYPSTRYFPSGPKTVEYREGLYVGYRYFDKAKKTVLFPFGYGLSYTSFVYSGLNLSSQRISDQQELKVSIRVRNTGKVAGAEIVQLYVRDTSTTIFRPEKELKGFQKVTLQPGEEKQVEFSLDKRAFAYYNLSIKDWHVESGTFDILIGASSADIRAAGNVWVESSQPGVVVPDLRTSADIFYNPPAENFIVDTATFQILYGKALPSNQRQPGEKHTINTPLSDLKDNFIGRKLYDNFLKAFNNVLGVSDNEANKRMMTKMLDDLPLRNLMIFSGGKFSERLVNALLLMMNGKIIPGFIKLVGAMVKKG
jgi:beta-glucosidase